jgi:hypothetical protein
MGGSLGSEDSVIRDASALRRVGSRRVSATFGTLDASRGPDHDAR